jgi:hypothetical protein
MIHKDFPRHLTFSYMAGSLQGGLRDFCSFAAQGRCVAAPWNGMAITHRSTLPCTPKTAHTTLSSCRI